MALTELLYPLDSYRKEFSSLVEGTEQNNVILSSTAFYPGGGGQPSDTGVLTWGSEQARVVSVKRDGPNVIHVLEGPLPARGTVIPREEAFRIPDLIRTKINLLPEGIAEVRIVHIEGLDLQADGGTHVANTSEVGRIKVVGYENKGKINKRLRITVD